ncbi:MAG: NAD(P)-dependent oxidoreductase [Pseudomonadales bacterium]|nr:NAD(P)-dependent oxidoreductase [Pseudomonadales bacterium]MCP5183921.1 NAD(P)-dependent oxidoreductase [Pseudomonadales bacterium]
MQQPSPTLEGQRLAFIGLGVMGYPMAGHLRRHGASVAVYNRTPGKALAWTEDYQGTAHTTPRGAAAEAAIVFLCVGNDDDVRSVVYGDDGVLAGMAPGTLLVDHTTASAELAEELGAACAENDIGFLDAPVSGGQAGAVNGALTIMVGGQEADFQRGRAVMEVYAKEIRRMGGVGAGQVTKMVNQICIAGILQGLAEGVAFAEKAGLDVGEVVGVISQGAAQSWQMNNRAHTMAKNEFDFGFAVDWMRKDLGIALDKARGLGVSLPLTALVDQFYGDVQRMGGGRNDTSSLIRRLR